MTPAFLLAAADADEAVAVVSLLAVMGVVALVVFVISLAMAVAVCLIVTSALARVPVEHRKMEPGQVWLLLIPCFGLVWNFFVFQRVPDSFRSYFEARGRTEFGDCGRGLGLAYAITAVLCTLPLVNYLAAPACLVLLIVSLVRFHELKRHLGP
jgi:hypothetical protein